MFIVVPYISSNKDIFGVYTICISITLFLSYADLGFMSAGQKYAAEHLVRGEADMEAKLIGFVSFILLIFLILFSLLFFYLSLHPWLLIRKLVPGVEFSIASTLLLILAISTPINLLQRIVQIIFGIRLEGYIVQRINIIGSLIRILSVLWFFRIGHYNIVGYFIFAQIILFLTVIIALISARRRYNYNFRLLAISIWFSKEIFSKTKRLAFSGLYLTIVWILYYEMDPTIIGKFIGAKEVAIYAIGLTLLSFFRGVLGILFFPFNNRWFHFIGANDVEGLKTFCLHVITITAPLVIIPIITITIFIKSFILSWVGVKYIGSVDIARYLVLCNLFAFISYPTSEILFAQERLRLITIFGTILPFVYWVGIVLTYPYLGLKAFAIFKLFIFGISGIAYGFIIIKFLNISFKRFLRKIFQPMLLPIIFLFVSAFIVKGFMPYGKSSLNLLIVTTTAGCLMLITFILLYFSSTDIRKYIVKIFQQYE